MADPNTQIDWWIAQAWQEAQGGAENDALVVWLHENGLTAVSSYTILQAALSCPPDTAKEIVFSHPVWAGEDPDADVDSLNYTTDTLEPEPEPDGAFELDGWAEEVEEDGPVYGEEGYEPEPGAGASPPTYDAQSPEHAEIQEAILRDSAQSKAPDSSQGFEEASGFDDAPCLGDDADGSGLEPHTMAPMDAMPTDPEPEPLEPEPIFEPDPAPAPMQADLMAPMDAMPAAPAPAPAPTVAPPVVRRPPATPAERAAVFAGAFGKKPAAAPQSPAPEPAPRTASPETPPGASGDDPPEGPPPLPREPGAAYQNLPLPTGNVASLTQEAAPAQMEPEPPQPAMPPVPIPPPLVYEPLPNIDLPQPVMAAEPLFSSPQRDPQPAPPLFPPAPPGQSMTDADLLAQEQPADPEVMAEQVGESVSPGSAPEELSAPDTGDALDEPDSAVPSNGLDPAAEPDSAITEEYLELEMEPEPEMELELEMEPDFAVDMDDPGDLRPGMLAAMQHDGAESRDELSESPTLDMEDEDAKQAEYIAEDHDPDRPSSIAHGEADEDTAPRPQKRVLLDPTAKPERGGVSGDDPGEIPLGETPEEMAEAARKLGVDFRGGVSDERMDPEMASVAKQLGISFRNDSGADELMDDDLSNAAQKLGISFRDGDSTSGKKQKPPIVKYLPMILVIFVVCVLLLLGLTFAGPLIELL
jgi:hypothetical protein